MKRTRGNKGFTLLEIMLVVGIIALLVGVAAVKLGGTTNTAKVVAATANIQQIKAALRSYETLALRLPTTSQGLQSLVSRPSLPPAPKRWIQQMEVLPDDPWSNPYQYRNPGRKNPNSYDVFSFGPDGVESADDIYE